MIEIHKSGTLAELKLGSVPAMITAASIRFENVQYELSYYHNGEMKTTWCNEKEFIVSNSEKQKVGFK
jgi:hypothetical protein